MIQPNESMDAILAKLTEMQATLDAQQMTITRQQEAILALQRNATPPVTGSEAQPLRAVSPEIYEAQETPEDPEEQEPRAGVSRRGLLRGAAAATAAATVGAAALGGMQTAHAAPAVDGGNLVLGTFNTATMQTTIQDTGANAQCMFEVQNNATQGPTNVAIYGVGQYGASGVNGQSSTGYGVWGYTSNNGIGVYGQDPGSSAGILGSSANGVGVSGTGTTNGWGVVGQSSAGYDFVANGTGIIGVNVQAAAGAPTSGYFVIGDCIRDANGDLWLCTAGNGSNVGTWVKVTHVLPGLTGGAISYLSKPIRLFDSRSGATDAASTPGALCTSTTPTTVQVAGVSFNGVTVPGSLAGAIGNVTVINEQGGGYLELVPSGAGFTGAANLAFAPGQIISNAFNVGLSSTGTLDIIIGGASTDVIIDLFAVVA